jgi:hypothetical protein
MRHIEAFQPSLFESPTIIFTIKIYISSECQNFAAARFQPFIQEFFARFWKRALSSLRAFPMSSAYASLKVGWQKILQWE